MLELRGMSRRDLQALAEKQGIDATLKSGAIISLMCEQRRAVALLGGNLKSSADVVREVKMEFEELTRRHMADLERLAAKASKLFAKHGVPRCEEVVAHFYEEAITTMTTAQSHINPFLPASVIKPAGVEPMSAEVPPPASIKHAGVESKPDALSGNSGEPTPVSAVRSTRKARSRRARKPKAAPARSATSFDLHGTIVKVNHESKFAFIRTASRHTDFYVGRHQFHRGMELGDEVSFEGEIKSRVQGGRCPEAYRVNLLARAWIRYR